MYVLTTFDAATIFAADTLYAADEATATAAFIPVLPTIWRGQLAERFDKGSLFSFKHVAAVAAKISLLQQSLF